MSYDYQELVTDLYRTLGTPATLLDARYQVLAFSDQPAELVDPIRREGLLVNAAGTAYGDAVIRHVNEVARGATSLTRIPPSTELGLLGRTVVPLGGKVPVAFVYLVDPGQQVREEHIAEFQAALDSVAAQVAFDRMSRTRVRQAVAGLFSSDETERHLAVAALDELGVGGNPAPHRAVVATSNVPPGRVPDDTWRRLLGTGGLWTIRDGLAVAVSSGPRASAVAKLKSNARDIRESLPGVQFSLGIGGESNRLSNIRDSFRQSLRSLKLAQSKANETDVVSWDELGAWRTLLSIGREDALDSVDDRVGRFVQDETASTVEMVRQYLERTAEADEIAAAHHLHRTTMYAKIRRLQQRYDLRWDNAEDRLATVIGTRILQLHAPQPVDATADADEPPTRRGARPAGSRSSETTVRR